MTVTTGSEPAPEAGQSQQQAAQEATAAQQGTAQAAPGQEPGAGAGDDRTALTPEQVLEQTTDPAVKAYLAKVFADAEATRREAAANRTKATAAEQAAEEARRAAETDAERIERETRERDERLAALEQENRTLRVGAALQADATKAGAHNPERVASILDAQVELGEDGKPANIAELLAELKRTDPYLFKRDSADAAAGGGQGAAPAVVGVNDAIRSVAGPARAR